jgi:Ca2+-binding RTX toxin-like protein
MTVFTTLADVNVNTSPVGLDFGAVEDTGSVVSHTSKKFIVSVTGGAYTFQGTGFGAFDGHGWPTVGTIEKISVSQNATEVATFAGLSVGMALWRSLSERHDTAGFSQALLGANDTLVGAGGTQVLFGHTGDDVINGRDGADLINGGAGRDMMRGGEGKDRFAFSAAADSTLIRPDVINDLHDNDKIDLKAIDADRTTAGNQAFVLVAAFSNTPGELRVSVDAEGAVTFIRGDTDGDGEPDLSIVVDGPHASFDNFVL